ncbi:MAG: DUF4440 domain-containing protein [Gemmatimonadetes bacterium]|nr:DUF4440 domain-containing protein [Gemmatimonadota bacterium]
MMRPLRSTTLLLALLLGGCAADEATPPAEMDTAAAEADITAALESYGQAALAGDLDAALEWLTDDVHLMEPGIMLSGAGVRELFTELFSTSKFISFETQRHGLFIHEGAAYEVGIYDEVLETDGEEEVIAGIFFLRWELGDDGQWRMDQIVAGPRDAPEGM